MTSNFLPAVLIEADGVRGHLHRAGDGDENGVVLTHGAGSNCNAPLLLAVAAALHAAGLTVLRCDLPFRQKRPKGPPASVDGPGDRAGLRAAVGALRGIVSGRVALAGHSYGGRQASMLAADEPELVKALLLLSYPLHPPGKPGQLRTAHFAKFRTPVLFVHGAKDPFGSLSEMKTAITQIAARKRLIVVDGAGHDLKGGRFDVAALVDAMLELLDA